MSSVMKTYRNDMGKIQLTNKFKKRNKKQICSLKQ